MKTIRSISLLAATAAVVALATGCAATWGRAHHRKSSVVQYLYPEQSNPLDRPTIPELQLPLRVGVAFVPDQHSETHGFTLFDASNHPFTEKQKLALMKEVSASFKEYPFVRSIEIIPSAYLTPKGGFDNLNQLQSMFDIDVIALLSYDQVQFTDEGLLSVSYWTIVGAYIIEGEKNDTKTMLDAAVYDIKSRKLLFRAPGISQIKASATPVNLSQELRADSERGFQRASTNLVVNLKEQLTEFQDRARKAPEEYRVSVRPGFTGVSALDGVELLLLAGLGILFVWSRQGKVA